MINYTQEAKSDSSALEDPTVTITIMDRDLDMPLEGAILRFRNSEPVESDANGQAQLYIVTKSLVSISYPGYETRRVWIDSKDNGMVITLGIEEVFEGEELVVEASAWRAPEEETGTSRTADKKMIEATGRMGVVEDALASVKLLPGVTYSGGWGSLPSIRGGDPNDFSSTLNGFYLRSPFHWGGAFSIYNPNMVESAKLSHGVFSARYGQANSGLLEVTTRDAITPEKYYEINQSTSAMDLFVQTPIGNSAGFFMGGKITYLEGVFAVAGMSGQFPTVPYIRDAFGRFQWNPSASLQTSFTGLLTTDGIETAYDESNEDLHSTGGMDYAKIDGIAILSLNYLPSPTTNLNFLAGYNRSNTNYFISSAVSGEKSYTDPFRDWFDDTYGLPLPATYELDIDPLLQGDMEESFDTVQLRLALDKQLGGKALFTCGIEGSADFHEIMEDDYFFNWVSGSTDNIIINTKLNTIFKSAAYMETELSLLDRRLDITAGIRGDHFYIHNDNYTLNSLPAINPRLNIRLKLGEENRFALIAGTGLFSMVPLVASLIEEKYNIEDFEIGQDSSWLSILGGEYRPNEEWLISIEGYYRHYLHRLYFNNIGAGINTDNFRFHDDGIGHVIGADLLIHKLNGRKLDGYISYSFVWARLKNPSTDGMETAYFPDDPLGIWYFPDYHRFHNMNLVFNYRPVEGIQLTTRFTLASGKPLGRTGEITPDPVLLGTTVIERWTRDWSYDDTLRSGISIPLDIKVSKYGYIKNSKTKYEMYLGVENLLVLFYKPEGLTSYDPYTGNEIPDSSNADFTIPFPVPSFGIKLSF